MVTRILCIDENAINRRLLSLMLERLGYRPIVVGSEFAALAELRSQSVDLITMDMGVPMDAAGVKCFYQIKAELCAQHLQIPVVAITACAMFGDREKCLRLGLDDYLSKPFTSSSLETVVERSLEIGGKERRRAG